jgi:TatD DNase family protein
MNAAPDIRIIDSHCHLDVSEFDHDRDTVIQNTRNAGVEAIIVPAIEKKGWDKLLALCEKHSFLYPALGLHPVFLDQHQPEDIEALANTVEKNKPVAIGEIGLDFALRELDRNRQLTLFEQQLDIAEQTQLPVILHVRKAHDETVHILNKRKLAGGTVHAFSGSLQHGIKYHEMGFKLGFGGMLTFERSNKLRALASQLPLEALVLETDSPDMTVASHRGERNSPEYLPEVLQALAATRQQDVMLIAQSTTQQCSKLFGIETR